MTDECISFNPWWNGTKYMYNCILFIYYSTYINEDLIVHRCTRKSSNIFFSHIDVRVPTFQIDFLAVVVVVAFFLCFTYFCVNWFSFNGRWQFIHEICLNVLISSIRMEPFYVDLILTETTSSFYASRVTQCIAHYDNLHNFVSYHKTCPSDQNCSGLCCSDNDKYEYTFEMNAITALEFEQISNSIIDFIWKWSSKWITFKNTASAFRFIWFSSKKKLSFKYNNNSRNVRSSSGIDVPDYWRPQGMSKSIVHLPVIISVFLQTPCAQFHYFRIALLWGVNIIIISKRIYHWYGTNCSPIYHRNIPHYYRMSIQSWFWPSINSMKPFRISSKFIYKYSIQCY